jgi:DNA-binding PadR family transcriptional regulator
MRGRKSGLLPLELSILETGIEMRREGYPEFHGFLAASRMRDAGEARLLTARGTLYKALERLERQGFLSSHWEAPEVALTEGRPRRRLYRVAPAGELALREAQTAAAAVTPRLQPGGSPL